MGLLLDVVVGAGAGVGVGEEGTGEDGCIDCETVDIGGYWSFILWYLPSWCTG